MKVRCVDESLVLTVIQKIISVDRCLICDCPRQFHISQATYEVIKVQVLLGSSYVR